MPSGQLPFPVLPAASHASVYVWDQSVGMGGDVTSCYLLVELTSGELLCLSEPSPPFWERGEEPFHTFTENL